MNAAIFAREFHILTTVGRMKPDDALEFLSKAALTAKEGCHQKSPKTSYPDLPAGVHQRPPALSQTRQSR